MKLEVKELKEFYENGQLKIETILINGKKNGSYTAFYDNGQVKIKTNFFNDSIVGEYKEYYENGNILTDTYIFETQDYLFPDLSKKTELKFYGKTHTEYYKNKNIKIQIGKPELRSYQEFYENGQLKLSTQINNDFLIVGIHKYFGNYESFYDNGQLEIKTSYESSIINGLYEEYYENGTLKIKANYNKGSLNGTYEEFFANGNLKILKQPTGEKSNCGFNSDKGGFFYFTEYYENGKIKIKSVLKECVTIMARKTKGVKNIYYKSEWVYEGPYEEYYSNGKLKIVTQHEYHGIFGVYKEYYINGKIKIETEYGKFGKEGNYLEHFKSGKLKVKTVYFNDLINGEFKKYYKNGQIKINANYIITRESISDGHIPIYKTDNIKDGLYEEYSKDGHLKINTLYSNGLEINE